MSPYNFDRTYEKWKKLVENGNLLIAIVTLCTEVLGYFILKGNNQITTSISYYVTRFLIAPTLFNFGTLSISYFMMQSPHFAGRKGDYIPLVELLILCTSGAITHHIFPVIAAGLCFPIFVSIVYDNPKITRNIWLLSFLSLSAIYMERWYCQVYMGTDSPFLLMETMVNCALIISAYITCMILLKFWAEKKQIMEEMHKYELQLQEELNREPRTGLYNASAFLNKLYKETEKSRFTQWPLMCMMIDVDDFKRVNDTYGHAKGDKVLERAAVILQKHFKEEEFPTRYGGEEFACIVREGTIVDLKARAEAMRQEFMAQSYDFMDEPVTMSAGIAQWKVGMNDEALFEAADKALYRAKNMGKNRIVIWSDAYEKI